MTPLKKLTWLIKSYRVPGFWYLATPYSKYPGGLGDAFRDAARVAAALVKEEVPVFSPIAHSDPISLYGDVNPLDHDVWLPLDEHLMEAATGLIVAKMEGWATSYGVGVEIEHFRQAGKPVFYLDVSDILKPKDLEEACDRLNEKHGLKAILGEEEKTPHTTAGGFVDANPGISTRDPEAISANRKNHPLASGVLDYFPDALMTVAAVSKAGNDKHNPGQPMHHARGKSMDHADCILRHLKDRGTDDPEDDLPHSAKTAWRALALLQEECEARGVPLARGARCPDTAAQEHVESDQSHGALDDWYFKAAE